MKVTFVKVDSSCLLKFVTSFLKSEIFFHIYVSIIFMKVKICSLVFSKDRNRTPMS